MADDSQLRDELLFQLQTGHAHMKFEEAVANFPEDKMNAVFTNGEYTFWHLLEHIRRTQKDILDFMTSSDYKEPSWPNDYWPAKDAKATKEDWDQTVLSFVKDREELVKIVQDPKFEMFQKIERGTGQTIIREILVVVDHNSYHLGEFSIMRQVLDTWGDTTHG